VAEILRLTPTAHKDLIIRCRYALPNEACGFVTGHDGVGRYVLPVENVHEKPRRAFRMDPAQQVTTLHQVDRLMEDVIAVYHSHTFSPPLLSEADLDEATDLEPIYLIVSLAGHAPTMAAFRITRPTPDTKGFEPVAIEIVNETAAA
jgi:proteasome lid subunit RPN8/RPN11